MVATLLVVVGLLVISGVPEFPADVFDFRLKHLEDLILTSILKQEVPHLGFLLLSIAVEPTNSLL